MRRALVLVCCAALVSAAPALARPRVTVGTIPQITDRVRVIADLRLPPLALWNARRPASTDARRKLDVASASSRAYLRRLATAQDVAAAQIRAAIPQARIGRRFQVVLDALTVSLPDSRLPALLRQHELRKVYPSVQYTLADDRSASVIGADVLQRETGADGAGIKIAIVDDGIDQTNPFFDPKGYSYPSGFPRGAKHWTTPKVIVARVFPGPNAGRAGRLPLDPASSFHGTHVAGIAAGDAGTTAPAGADHPRVTGLTGVAPRAWLGNYRVFTVPTPIGHVANTPEIVAAFEAAVKDGMDVINFSGGGPQIDPANDALVEAIHDTTAAGVVTVIAAGNDRDDFGNGSAGSPGTAPDAISVAATSNTHVFAPALDVTAPGAPGLVQGIPFIGANGSWAPESWGTADQQLVDVGTIVGTDGKPVSRLLCGPPGALDVPRGTLPPGSLSGAIALADRGICPLTEKAAQARAAGAVGIVLADNRQGEANELSVDLGLPGGTISNLDAAHLRAYMSMHGGRTAIRVGRTPLELETGRSGVIASFSSSGPTAFGHDLKPDISAPGGQILSSTLANTDASRFAVFDGTSMATPHVAGAAALLLELHPSWTPAEIRSALVSTAAPAWADTARTQEAPVTLEGGGLVALPRATDPEIFTDPASLSFEDLAARTATASRGLLVRVTDAGDGAGTWQVQVEPQAATAGAALEAAGTVAVPPGGEGDLAVVAHAAAGAAAGEDYGFVVLEKDGVTRRVPYLFLVSNPKLAEATVVPLRRVQRGTTARGVDRVEAYRYPTNPFGNNPDEPPMDEVGAETVYRLSLERPAVNVGVSVVEHPPGARIDPWYLGALDEDTVQGFAGTPVNVNPLTYDYLVPDGAAGASFPRQGTYYVAVDSGRARFTGRSYAGRYVLRSWVDDVTPPTLRLLTTRVSAGRPTLVFRTTDSQSGVDPSSLTLGYEGTMIAVGSFDRATGLAAFPLPPSAPRLPIGTVRVTMLSSDYQEAKNVDTVGPNIMPNTRRASALVRVVARTALDWLAPAAGACVARRQRLVVAASSPTGVSGVRFEVDGRTVAHARGRRGVWTATVAIPPGSHRLAAVSAGTRIARAVRTCSA